MSSNKGAYLMARLTTKGLSPELIFGGKPELEKMDIAAACSRLDSLPFHLIMAKYCDDVKSALDAIGELQEVICAKSQDLAELPVCRRSAVAAAMIQEFVSAKRCGSCKGRGEKLEQSSVKPCKPCNGTGIKSVSIHARAKNSGIPDQTFRAHNLNRPYQDIMDHLLDLEISALSRISRRAA